MKRRADQGKCNGEVEQGNLVQCALFSAALSCGQRVFKQNPVVELSCIVNWQAKSADNPFIYTFRVMWCVVCVNLHIAHIYTLFGPSVW